MSDAETALTQYTENISEVSIETKLSPFLTMHTTTVLSTKEIYILDQAINSLCFIRCDTKDDLNSILPNVMSIFHLLPTQIKMIEKDTFKVLMKIQTQQIILIIQTLCPNNPFLIPNPTNLKLG